MSAPDDSGYDEARERLVDRLDRRIRRPTTREAMLAVPRHAFVPSDNRDAAYRDRPLPIGSGQTISSPHMVAEMLDALALEPGERVLEIGTGCGYHAALTAEVVGAGNIYSVEYETDLAERARQHLADLGYGGVSVRAGDGHAGWSEHAPYDAAYLTCAAPDFPDPVVEQVRPGGRLLGPLGASRQVLVHADRRDDGTLEREERGGVRFVPMRGGEEPGTTGSSDG